MSQHDLRRRPLSHFNWKLGLAAGLAGGFAEFLWIGSYSTFSGPSGAEITAQITQSIFPGTAQMAGASIAGLAIHFGLSLLLGLALIVPMRLMAQHGAMALIAASLTVLAGIWAVNFLVVLPVLNPVFPMLLPTWVSFLSKLLFGAAVAGVIGQAEGCFHPAISGRAIAATGRRI